MCFFHDVVVSVLDLLLLCCELSWYLLICYYYLLYICLYVMWCVVVFMICCFVVFVFLVRLFFCLIYLDWFCSLFRMISNCHLIMILSWFSFVSCYFYDVSLCSFIFCSDCFLSVSDFVISCYTLFCGFSWYFQFFGCVVICVVVIWCLLCVLWFVLISVVFVLGVCVFYLMWLSVCVFFMLSDVLVSWIWVCL